MARFACAFALVGMASAWSDKNFFDWFQDELREVVDSQLNFEGTVPSYLNGGTFVQTGPARFSFGKSKFLHMLDGYSKTNKIEFTKDGKAFYSTKFLASQFMNESIKKNGIARGMFVGGIDPNPHWGPTAAMGPNDNNYIKQRRIGRQDFLLADTMIGTELQEDSCTFKENIRAPILAAFVDGKKWDDSIQPAGDMCMLGTMAHGVIDPVTNVFTGLTGCFGLRNYHMAFTIDPATPTVRKLLAKIHLPKGRGPSYMHAFGATPNYIVLLAEPLYMNLAAVLEGKPLGQGGLITNDDPTLFQVVNRKTGAVRTLQDDGFIYGHVVNSFEDGDDIVIDLTWSASNNATTLGWMNRWLLQYMASSVIRESWPRTKIMRYRLKPDNTVERKVMFEDENGEDDFETPKINENYEGHNACIHYFIQFHSYEYDKDQNATKGGPFGCVGIAKRNICTGKRQGWYSDNMYPSEVQFIPNPAGKAEDDGVLMMMVFDGNTNSSFVQIMDAQTMERVAKAPLPIKTPFLIHATWFPPMPSQEVITV